MEDTATHPLSPITYSTGTTVTNVEESYGDSSKPISVYADAEMSNLVFSSSAGLKINCGDIMLKAPFALDDIGLSGSWTNGDSTTELSLSINIQKMRVEGKYSVTTGNKTIYNKVGVSGRFILVLVYILQTGDVSQLQPAYTN